MGTRRKQKVTLSRQLLGFLANAVKWKKSRGKKSRKCHSLAKKSHFIDGEARRVWVKEVKTFIPSAPRFSVCAMMQKAPSLCTDSADLIKKFNAHWSKNPEKMWFSQKKINKKIFELLILEPKSSNIWIFAPKMFYLFCHIWILEPKNYFYFIKFSNIFFSVFWKKYDFREKKIY